MNFEPYFEWNFTEEKMKFSPIKILPSNLSQKKFELKHIQINKLLKKRF